MPAKIILSFGEVLWDLLPTGEVLGGAPFNFAYRAHAFKYQSLMISRIGREEYGQRIWDQLLHLGMDHRLVQWDDTKPTGTVQIELDEYNQPDYFIVPNVAYDFIECTDDILEWAAKADCICFGTLVQRNSVSRQTLQTLLENAPDALKLLDINLRKECYSEETIVGSLQQADILKLNEDEAPYLSGLFSMPEDLPGFCAAMIERWALSHCVITLGARGVFIGSSDGTTVYVPGYRIELADPCGAGDAFTAGFMDRYFHGKSLWECGSFGNALGALVATQKGATVPVSLDAIHDFMESNPTLVIDSALDAYRER